jgi:hypothetical protein
MPAGILSIRLLGESGRFDAEASEEEWWGDGQ